MQKIGIRYVIEQLPYIKAIIMNEETFKMLYGNNPNYTCLVCGGVIFNTGDIKVMGMITVCLCRCHQLTKKLTKKVVDKKHSSVNRKYLITKRKQDKY